jgi:hypothetical protein
MPLISVTGSTDKSARSWSRSRTATAPKGLAVSLKSLARVRVRATPMVTGSPASWRMRSRVASAF